MSLTTYQLKMVIALILIMIISCYAVHWVYFKILRIAKDKNIVDNPDARKLQKTPIPVMGGIAVFFGLLVGVLASTALPYHFPEHTSLFPIICAMSLMLYIGAMDDIVGLTARSRLVIEILTILGLIYSSGGCIDTFRGLWGIYQFSWWIGVPLTVVAGVGIINAVNMIDGVNGLSSGLCMVCSAMFGVLFVRSGDMHNAYLAFAMAASLLPFFVHNVFGMRSRMFIGDAGTMVMGIMMTWFVMCILKNDTRLTYYAGAKGVNLIALALAIMSVPVFDTLRVMTMRIMKGINPFRPDKTHLHHVFINIGISHSITSLTEILIASTIVAIWAIADKTRVSYDMQLYIVIIASVVLVWGTYFFLRYHVNHHTNLLHRLTHFSVATHLGRREWWKRLTSILDAPEKDEYLTVDDEAHAEHMTRKYEHQSPYEQSRLKVRTYVMSRAESVIEDIREYSGASKEYVDKILKDAIEDGRIVVVKYDKDGNPEMIAKVEE